MNFDHGIDTSSKLVVKGSSHNAFRTKNGRFSEMLELTVPMGWTAICLDVTAGLTLAGRQCMQLSLRPWMAQLASGLTTHSRDSAS